jgi:VCBS repeat-containing protein
MSNLKKQDRLRDGSRKKRRLQVERLEQRQLLTTISEYASASSGPTAITADPYYSGAGSAGLAYILNGTDKIGFISSTNPSSGGVVMTTLPNGANPAALVDAGSNLFVTEPGLREVAEINAVGTLVHQYPDTFQIGDTFGSPQGITADAAGDVFYTDQNAGEIYEIPASATYPATPVAFSSAGSDPTAITDFTSGGDEYLAWIQSTSQVATYNLTTNTADGTINLGGADNALGLTGDSLGDIDITNQAANGIIQLSGAGFSSQTEYTIPTSNSNPVGITADGSGNVYFAEGGTSKIGTFNATTHAFTEITTPTGSSSPYGITIGPNGEPWFTESNASQIGELVTVVSAAPQSFTTNPINTDNTSSLTVTSSSATNLLTGSSGGGSLTVSQTGTEATAHGSVTFDANGDGGFVYTPTSGYSGPDSFTYTVTNGTLTSDSETVTLTVDAPPVAVNDSYITPVDTPLLVLNPDLGVLANDTDPNEGHTLTSTIVAEPGHGIVTLCLNGTFSYTPNAGYHGFDTFTYEDTDSDGISVSNLATVTIAVDTAPVAVADSYTTDENTTLNVPLAANGVLAYDTQAQGEPLTSSVVSQPTNGTVTLNPDGSFTYIPNSQFFGTDSFTYDASDGFTTSDPATVTINVAEDFAPTANNVSQPVGEGGITVTAPGILTGDTDSNGQPLTAVLVSEPTHGSLTFNANGSYVYTPNSSFGTAGSDSFTFRTFDQVLTSTLATVTLTFDGSYEAPVAQAQTYSVDEGTTLSPSASTGVLTGASDVWNLGLTAIDVTQPSHGTLTLNPDGSFSYTPTAGYFGPDSFTYEANNGHVNSSPQTVTLNVAQVIAAPVAVNDSYTTSEGATLTTTTQNGVLANDTDNSDTPLTAVLVTGPTEGTLNLNANGSFTYTPNPMYFGSDSFTYEAFDGTNDSQPATVMLTVTQGTQPAVVVDSTFSITEATTLTINGIGVLAGATNSDNLPLTAVLVTGPTHGTLTLNANGSFTYLPNPMFTGTDSFTFEASDGEIDSNVATVTLTVAPIDPPAVAPKPDPVAGDYFGTGVADIAVYLVNQGEFAIQPSTGGPAVIVPFGIAGAGQTLPAPGDYFGTGVTDIAAYLPSQGVFAIRNPAGGPDEIIPFGIAGAGQTLPAPGDYFGTGQTDIAAYLPSIGAFGIRNPAGGPDEIIPFGMAGLGNSIPVPGDYDGSGKTELAVYMPSLGEFAYRPANGGPDVIVKFGMAGTGNSIPMPGDYDGSGKTEFAVYMPSLGEFVYRPANGGPDVVESFGIAGAGQTLPAPGDYTGVGHDELAAFLPSTATFAIRPGGGQPDITGSFGAAGLGQTIPVTVVDQALAEIPDSTLTALSIDIPDPSTITDSVIFPSDSATEKKKKHLSE